MSVPHYVIGYLKYTSQQLLEIFGFFETFLCVDQYFIPKKLIFTWPFEGWANQAAAHYQNLPNLGRFGSGQLPCWSSLEKATLRSTFWI